MRMQDYQAEAGPFRTKTTIPSDPRDLRIMELERRVAELEAVMPMPAPIPVPGGPWPSTTQPGLPEWEIYCAAYYADARMDFS